MRLLIFACFVSVLPATVSAQQYLIKYDLNSLKSNYYRIGSDTARVRTLDLKKNGRIILQVENYNPYYWNAKVTSYKNPVQEETGYANAFNPLGILSQGFGDILSNIPFLDLPKSRGTTTGTDANSRFLNAVSRFSQNYEKVQTAMTKYEELTIVKMQLKELKYNNLKTEEAIKSEARDLVRNALGTDSVNLITFIRMGKTMNTELVNAVDDLMSSYQQLQQTDGVDMASRVEGKTFNEMTGNISRSYSSITKVKEVIQKDPSFLVDEVVEVGSLYRDIATAKFNFTYSVNTEPDLSYLKLQLFPRIDSLSKDTMVQYFEIKGKKQMKIRNSVGVAFSYFKANDRKYFIDSDSVISQSRSNLFNPIVATFIHFYGGQSAGFRWGGNFGVGIPLTGDKKDINFMLGLSTAFGQNEPIMLSAGLIGGKTSKLTNGYMLGQKTKITDPDKLVSSSYDLGGYIGISFNLSTLGKK
jgi:hypothetical protein